MWSPMGPHVQWNLSNVVTCGTSCTYSGTCLMWSPMGPHVQWNLSHVDTFGILISLLVLSGQVIVLIKFETSVKSW